ncbi:hypothetical protein [Natrinema sp. 1APR25-10V2]|uniref:hypothetical protein n=1 Tax=Natrinema sp. 1APR25-10V2 TaxID=2951081 RepID=UPI002876B33F|nr:hypothetical protein [Natrinema sp. 1APR25-10V2]MDS0476968.1 hypothetical protein [Natrinema sp. 1APR25-10V2]
MDERTDADTPPTDAAERQLCRFSGWCKKTGYSLEYWEVFVTDQRLIFCFIGESYSSLLLKADMGAAHRDRLSDYSLSEITAFDDRNFTVPVHALRRVELTRSSWIKKTSLRFVWEDGEIEFFDVSQTSSEKDATSNMARLSEHDEYVDVAISVSDRQFTPFSFWQ